MNAGATTQIVSYGSELETEITQLTSLICAEIELAEQYSPRWLAIKLLEDDRHVVERLNASIGTQNIVAAAQVCRARLERTLRCDSDTLIADRRYAAINAIVRDVVTRPQQGQQTFSDRMDGFLTHPLIGLPVFAAIMFFIFQMTASVSTYYIDWIDGIFGGPLSRWVAALLGLVGLSETWFEALLLDGVLAGVGGVLVFIPVMAFMYFFLAVLEDSGYMARAAFLADRFMHVIGLHGKSFIPMLLGFGCNVPGIYATRTLKNERDRLLTGLLVPFMSCGARMPVYVVIGAAFFGTQAGLLIFGMYILGIIVAITVGLLLKNTLLHNDEETPFLIELPPYRVPSLKNVLLYASEHTKSFVENAWTIVLIVSVIVWLLLAIPVNAPQGASFAQVETSDSALAAVAGVIAPVFEPAGFGTWESASAMVTGFVAKEVVISTLSEIYVGAENETLEPVLFIADVKFIGVSFVTATVDTLRATVSLIPGINLLDQTGEDTNASLVRALRQSFTPLSAVAFCAFILLTAPCVVTIGAMRQEFGGRWMAFSVGLMFAVAWIVSTLIYQGGLLLGYG